MKLDRRAIEHFYSKQQSVANALRQLASAAPQFKSIADEEEWRLLMIRKKSIRQQVAAFFESAESSGKASPADAQALIRAIECLNETIVSAEAELRGP